MSLTRFEFTSRARPIMEVGLGSSVVGEGAALWDVALWDAALSLWNGDEPLWRDVACDVVEARLELGRGRITDAFPVATAQVQVDNNSGWADPSTDDTPGVLRLRPGRQIRIGVQHATAGTCWLYRGFIDAIEPVDDPEDWSTVNLRCIDALGEAGRAKLITDVETGAGEQARTRFARILNAIQWPTTKRNISVSAIRQMLAAKMSGQVVDLLRRTAESEGGWAYADTEGNIVLQNRDWLYHEIDPTVDAFIGNFGGNVLDLLIEDLTDLLIEQGDVMLLEETEEEVCPSRWVRSFDRSDITTRVILDRSWPSTEDDPGLPIQVDDLPAQVLYGIEPFERLDLWTQSDGATLENAGRILATRSASVSMPRVSSVTIDAATGDDAVDLLATLSIFEPSVYQGRLRNDRGVVFDERFFAVGVTHEITAGNWTAEISLDRTTPFETLDPIDYEWDVALWDRSLWN